MDTEKDNNIIQEQNPLPTETIPNGNIKPEKTKSPINKKVKIILLVVIAILSLFLGIIIASQFNPQDSQTIEQEKQEDVEVIEEEINEEDGEDTDEVSKQPYSQYPVYTDAKTTDVSEYTDIVLNNYEGLSVNIFENPEEDERYIGGIVRYELTGYSKVGEEDTETDEEKRAKYGPRLTMRIVNRKSIINSIQQNSFNQATSDIKNKDLTSKYINLRGELSAFETSPSGAAHPLVKEIRNIQYSGTDNTFAILTLGGFQDGPFVPHSDENIGSPFSIIIYAIKGDNIISLDSFYSNTAELGVTKEKHMSCVDNQDGEYPDNAWLGIYDHKCLIDILKDTQYDAKIRELSNNLLNRFKLKSV